MLTIILRRRYWTLPLMATRHTPGLGFLVQVPLFREPVSRATELVMVVLRYGDGKIRPWQYLTRPSTAIPHRGVARLVET